MGLLNRLISWFRGFNLTEHTRLQAGFRTAQREDIPQLLAIERDVYSGQTPWTELHFLREIDNNPEAVFIVAEDGGQIIAFIGLRVWLARRELHVTNFAVLSSRQQQGLGHQLMDHALDLAHNLKVTKVSLETARDNQKAQSFYYHTGFISTQILLSYYEDGKDALMMEKAL